MHVWREHTLALLGASCRPEADGAGLTSSGARQAECLGCRLAHLPLSRITHGPLWRAAETARVAAEQFEHPPSLSEVDAAGDYVPHVPGREEVPDAWVDAVLSSFPDVSEEEASHRHVRAFAPIGQAAASVSIAAE